MERARWIVVGIDFSEGAIGAIRYSHGLATALGANVAYVHAYEDGPGTPASHDPSPVLKQQIEDLVAHALPATSTLQTDAIVRRGAPWDKLANVATELGAELIVVGADGQRGVANDGFVGSVATRLVATAPRSVVVVRSTTPSKRTAS